MLTETELLDQDNISENNNNNNNNPGYKTIILTPELQLDEIVIKMFAHLNIEINEISELDELVLDRDIFIDNSLYPKLYTYIANIKDFLKSSYLTSLQSNCDKKQRFPCINLFRQILKCYRYKMSPLVISQGYNKSTGKKIIKRFFKIESF